MRVKTCRIILTGEIVTGKTVDQVASRISVLFKCNLSMARAMLGGQPKVIKRGLDPQTAQKYKTAITSAGAVCRIEPDAVSKNSSSDTPQTTDASAKENIQVLNPVVGPKSDFYSPLLCNEISGSSEGLSSNRQDISGISFKDLLLVSVFFFESTTDTDPKIALFFKGSKRPLMAEAVKIRFHTMFPAKPSVADSLREFIRFLHHKNRAIRIDPGTFGFLNYQRPEIEEEKTISFLSDIGRAVENIPEDVMQKTVPAEPVSSKNAAGANRKMDRQPADFSANQREKSVEKTPHSIVNAPKPLKENISRIPASGPTHRNRRTQEPETEKRSVFSSGNYLSYGIGVLLLAFIVFGVYSWRLYFSPPPTREEINAALMPQNFQQSMFIQSTLLKQGCLVSGKPETKIDSIQKSDDVLFPGKSKYLVTMLVTGKCIARGHFRIETDYLFVRDPPDFLYMDSKERWGVWPLQYYYDTSALKNWKDLKKNVMDKVDSKMMQSFVGFLMIAGKMEKDERGISSWKLNDDHIRINFN